MESSSELVAFPLLMTPIESNYRACTIPYRFPSDNPRKPTPTELQWIDLFFNSIPSFKYFLLLLLLRFINSDYFIHCMGFCFIFMCPLSGNELKLILQLWMLLLKLKSLLKGNLLFLAASWYLYIKSSGLCLVFVIKCIRISFCKWIFYLSMQWIKNIHFFNYDICFSCAFW